VKELMSDFFQRAGLTEKSFNYLVLKGYVHPESLKGAFIETEKAFHLLWEAPSAEEGARREAAAGNLTNHLVLLCDAVDILCRCYGELPLNSEQQDTIRKALIETQHLLKKAVLGEENK
jgi:hypothetical protein